MPRKPAEPAINAALTSTNIFLEKRSRGNKKELKWLPQADGLFAYYLLIHPERNPLT
jgi:hypothetical protein